MLSRKLEDLNSEDLDYLDKLLSKESLKENDGYRIQRIREAVRSQSKLKNMPKW